MGEDGLPPGMHYPSAQKLSPRTLIRGPAVALHRDVVEQVTPTRIVLRDQIEFPGAPPSLDLLLAFDRGGDVDVDPLTTISVEFSEPLQPETVGDLLSVSVGGTL